MVFGGTLEKVVKLGTWLYAGVGCDMLVSMVVSRGTWGQAVISGDGR